jgi:hypothetical protein
MKTGVFSVDEIIKLLHIRGFVPSKLYIYLKKGD